MKKSSDMDTWKPETHRLYKCTPPPPHRSPTAPILLLGKGCVTIGVTSVHGGHPVSDKDPQKDMVPLCPTQSADQDMAPSNPSYLGPCSGRGSCFFPRCSAAVCRCGVADAMFTVNMVALAGVFTPGELEVLVDGPQPGLILLLAPF